MIFLTSTAESFFQLLVVLFIFVVVLALTYYTTRWIGGYQKAQMRSNNLAVVETLRITQNKYVQLIRVGKDRYFAIALGKDEVVPLGEVSREDLCNLSALEDDNVPTIQGDFKDILDKLRRKDNDE